MALAKYIVVPSGVKAVMPSSNSVLSSPSAACGRCQLPFSSFFEKYTSLHFVPVISLRFSPFDFSVLEV